MRWTLFLLFLKELVADQQCSSLSGFVINSPEMGRIKGISDAGECCRICGVTPGCAGFSIDGNDCSLKTGTSVAAKAGSVSGVLSPSPGPPPTTPAPPSPWEPGTPPKCTKDNSCTAPQDGASMAKYLSKNYNAFDPKTMSGDSLGVYVTMQPGGDLHHYCSTLTGAGDCFLGRADCTLSVALYNRYIMLDGDKQGAHLKLFAGRSAGYVINTSLAETRYNKCAYIFDGASTFKLNQGCGGFAMGQQSCSNRGSAYYDICVSTNKTCTINDPEIQPNTNCESIVKPGIHHRKWPNTTGEAPCYFTGPAFGYSYVNPKVDAKDNKIGKMVENRIYNQNPNPGDCSNPMDQCPGHPPAGEGGACCPRWKHGVKTPCEPIQTDCNRLAKWNEVVMDLRPMIEDLKTDPNVVIPAFVYAAGHKVDAERLRDTFKKQYAPIGDVPLILMDETKDVTQQDKYGPPFVFEGTEAESTIAI